MKNSPTSKVVDLLLDTLERVERKAECGPDEATMQKLKTKVFRLVAQFEAARSCEGASSGSGE